MDIKGHICGAPLDPRWVCPGGVPPPLEWKPIPGAVSYALICHDPDAPHPGGWSHWVVYQIPPEATGINPADVKMALNSWGKAEYGPPCPPRGDPPHRYFFCLYALNVSLTGIQNLEQLWKAMKGHIIGQAATMGTYQRGL